jgi:hypothetical protein
VSDAVVIEAPYRSEDCRLITGAAKESLGRVKKVVSTLLIKTIFDISRVDANTMLAREREEEDHGKGWRDSTCSASCCSTQRTKKGRLRILLLGPPAIVTWALPLSEWCRDGRKVLQRDDRWQSVDRRFDACKWHLSRDT